MPSDPAPEPLAPGDASGDAEAWETLGRHLREIGYGEEGLCRLLGVEELHGLSAHRWPLYADRLDAGRPLDDLARLLLLGLDLSPEAAREALTPDGVDLLRRAGILAVEGGSVRSYLGLYPCLDALVWSDPAVPDRHQATAPADQPVMAPGGDTRVLARCVPREPVDGVLDLCTGPGVQAILCARHAEEVVATDVAPRALRFARVNGLLNGVDDRIAWTRSDLDDGIDPDRRFDLLVANPPFVPGPARRLAYRDGGPLGDEVLASVCRALGRRLVREGRAFVVTHLARRNGDDGQRRIAEWLRGSGLSALSFELGVEPAAEYVLDQLAPTARVAPDRHPERLREWLDHYRFHGIESVAGCLLAFGPTAGAATEDWVEAVDAAPPGAPCGEAVLDAFADVARSRSVVFPDEVLGEVPRSAPGIELRSTRPVGRKGAVGRTHELRQRAGVSGDIRRVRLEVGREVRALLEMVDGHRTLGDLVETYADLRDEARSRGWVVRTVLDLCKRGVLRMAS